MSTLPNILGAIKRQAPYPVPPSMGLEGWRTFFEKRSLTLQAQNKMTHPKTEHLK
jgi:hypothetical protein